MPFNVMKVRGHGRNSEERTDLLQAKLVFSIKKMALQSTLWVEFSANRMEPRGLIDALPCIVSIDNNLPLWGTASERLGRIRFANRSGDTHAAGTPCRGCDENGIGHRPTKLDHP